MDIKEQIKNGLEAGKTLTVLDALNQFRTIELRKYVSMLRKEGLNIQDRWVSKNGKRFKEYFKGVRVELGTCFKRV